MSPNLIVAVTDDDWFNLLRQQQGLEDVNFWKPNAQTAFRALVPGELLLFKLHSPRDYIVGGGVFVHANTMPCSLAWRAFGIGNGARTEAEMRQRILQYRSMNQDDRSDFTIGCRVLSEPFFLEERDWIPVPASWSKNIVQFKTYNTGEPEGRALWDALLMARAATLSTAPAAAAGAYEGAADERWGRPQIIQPRLGQGAFRVRLAQPELLPEFMPPMNQAVPTRTYSDFNLGEGT
jgi:putative restriction endonuclease